jgi:hypothetical protein
VIGLALAAALAQASPQADPGERIGQSAAAAEALQGALDGRWWLIDAAGRPLYQLQITDPAEPADALSAAWRDPASSRTGAVSAIHRSGRALRIVFASPGEPDIQVRLALENGVWRGAMVQGARRAPVRLTRR